MAKSVFIAGNSYEIQRFRGLKAIMAIAAVTRVAKEVPDILSDVGKQFTKRHTVTITESMSRLPRWAGFTKEDFDRAEKDTGKRELEIPGAMTQQDAIMQALPLLLEQARKEVVRLLAVLIVPNDELREADQADKIEEKLDSYYDLLMYDADLEELAELALQAKAILDEQIGEKKDRLGNLLGGVRTSLMGQRQSTPLSRMTTEELEAEISRTSPDDAPTLSTPSPPPTDGPETKSSSESLGVS